MDILGFCILRRCGALGCTAAVIALSDAGRQSTAVGLQATSLRRLRVRMRYKLESHFDLDLVANPERRFEILGPGLGVRSGSGFWIMVANPTPDRGPALGSLIHYQSGSELG